MVTHNMEHALAMGPRIVVMIRGRIVGDVGGDENATSTPPISSTSSPAPATRSATACCCPRSTNYGVG